MFCSFYKIFINKISQSWPTLVDCGFDDTAFHKVTGPLTWTIKDKIYKFCHGLEHCQIHSQSELLTTPHDMEQNHQLCNPSELVGFLHEMDQCHQTANKKSISVCQVSLWNGISSKPQSIKVGQVCQVFLWNGISFKPQSIKAGQVCQVSLWNGLSSKPQSIEVGQVPSCNGSVSPNPQSIWVGQVSWWNRTSANPQSIWAGP